MAAAIVVAALGSIAFVVWLVWRAVREKSLKAHVVSYAIAILAGVFTYGYFLSLDVPQLIKVVVSIVIGVGLIFWAARHQRRTGRA